jgi:hypothetical protein
MAIDPEVLQEIADEVVLQFVLDGDLSVSPACVDALALEVARAMRRSLREEERRHRWIRAASDPNADEELRRHARRRLASMLSVVESVISVLRRSQNVKQVRADDATLHWKLLTVVRLLASTARTPAEVQRSSSSGGSGSLPPASGAPAEARVSEQPPAARLPPEDLDRRKRRRGRN